MNANKLEGCLSLGLPQSPCSLERRDNVHELDNEQIQDVGEALIFFPDRADQEPCSASLPAGSQPYHALVVASSWPSVRRNGPGRRFPHAPALVPQKLSWPSQSARTGAVHK